MDISTEKGDHILFFGGGGRTLEKHIAGAHLNPHAGGRRGGALEPACWGEAGGAL